MNLPSDSVTVRICNVRGLHARASARLASCASGFDAEIVVHDGDQSVNAKSIMDLLMLAAGQNTPLRLSASGPQASEALAALSALIADGFGEGV